MGKGANTTSTASSNTSAPDPQAAAAYRDILTRAQGVAGTPYQAYTGNLTADVNSQQNTGISGINANAGFASPYVQQAAGMAGQYAAPISAGDIQHYMDPYTQQVVDATTGQLMHDFGQQGAQLTGNQISQGALGGNATGVARGVLGGQQARTLASTTAGLYSQGYQQAMDAAQRQQATGLQGANAIANYGISGQNAALTGAGQQVAAGTLQQQTEQARLNALYGQYAQAQAFPYQQTQWLAGVGTGVGSNLGGTNMGTGTTTAAPPNQTAQWLGLGLSAASLLSDRRAKEDVEHIGKMNDGTPIYRFRYKGSQQMHVGPMAQDVERRNPDAVSRGVDGMRYVDMEEATDDSVARRADGGGVGGIPWGGAQGWIPTMAIHGGAGAPGAGHAPSAPSSGQSAFDPSKLGAGISGAAKGLGKLDWGGLYNSGGNFSGDAWGGGSFLGGDAYGGSSSNPTPGIDPSEYGAGFADGGGVMSDADPVGISPGRYAQAAGPYLIRPNQDGTHSVVNTRTGQIHFTGTPSGASNAQASLIYRNRADGGAVFSERFDGEPRSNAWDHFKGGAQDFFGGMHDVASGIRPRSPIGTSRALWERDRANRYARGGGIDDGPMPPWMRNVTPEPQPDLMNGDPAWTDPAYNSDAPDNVRNGDPAWDVAGVPTPRPRPEQTFSDRFAPASEGVAAGTMQARDDTVVNPGNPVRLQGSTYGPQGAPAVAASDDDEDTAPPNAAPTSGLGVAGKPPSYYDRPDAVVRPREREGWGLGLLSPNAQTGLLTAGLGMLASRSPNLGNAVGEGALAGVGAYGAAEERDRQVATEAAKLSREADKTVYDRWMGERKQGETERHNKAAENKDFKPTWGQVDEDPITGRKIMGWIDPNKKTTTVPGKTAAPGADASGATGVTAPTAGAIPAHLTGQPYMDALTEANPGFARTAKAVGDYKASITSLSQKGGLREKILEAALRYNPDFDQTHFAGKNRAVTAFAAGPEGRTVRSLNVSIDHIGTLEEAGVALQNGNYPALNKIVNYFREKTGSPLTTNFDSIKQVVSAEIAKAVVGGQTALHDRDDMAQRAANSQGPDQLAGIFKEFKKLMAGQMKGLRRQYEVSTGLKNFDDFLEPQTKKQLEAVQAKEADGKGAGGDGKGASRFPADAIARQYNGKTYYYDPNTKQPYPGQ